MPFKIADDPQTDYRELVRTAYNRCAMNYAGQRRTTAEAELNLITERLTPSSKILDVGCGAGIPVSRHLAGTFSLTGIDISSSMIALAKKNVPKAKFVIADVMETEFPACSFDAIVSFYAIFHIPRQEHLNLFRRFAQWLRPGGLLLFTIAKQDDGPGYTEDDFFGETMYWSNFGPSTYEKFLTETGFQIEQEGIVGGGYESADALEEVHPFFFSVKREGL
ncbi:MAG: methyltransferase domain-containing protein [Gemmatimonadetes bacterium]|nr:methyltransferase domain-containing protein [Gemmatimonadota bacterium]